MIFAFSAFSSAFGGILAFGLTQIRTAHFAGWRWLFAVEGAMTFIAVPIFWVVFPNSPTDAWFLTADEKQMMKARYDSDPSWGHTEEFSWNECFKVFVDPKWYAFFAYQFSVDISLYGLTTFMPAIVSGLGYTSYHANLMTVPIYVCALIFFLVIAYFSDRTGYRGPYLAGCLLCLIIGYALLISVDNLKVRFFACFGKLSFFPIRNPAILTLFQWRLWGSIQRPDYR
jgi:MFS family permease